VRLNGVHDGRRRNGLVSDVSEGPGWWQAADGKWYRPESSRAASSRGNRIGCFPIAVAATLVLIAIVAVGVAFRRSSTRTRRVHAPSSTVSTGTTTTAATTTTTPTIVYRVKPGDTLTKIAAQFHVPISAIVRRNHIANPNRLGEGQNLVIPPAPPLKLIITPPQGQAGDAFQLALTGAVPSETIRFQIDSGKAKFTGGPHTSSADGAVSATYVSGLAGPAGTYTVTATGNMGTSVQAHFVVVAATNNT
jgi:LysM repeat protein